MNDWLPPARPRTPWSGLLRASAETLTPAEDDAKAVVEALATCQPWSVRVGTWRLRVIYANPPTTDGDA